MNSKEVWFITGASRGMGVDFAKAALASGHAVVATGRDTDAVAKAVEKSNDLLAVRLDVGSIDVLVNNAASLRLP
jgi:NAD(P)-dependent dehydrogenase (short-subunit alcohol dehydrogenase family)